MFRVFDALVAVSSGELLRLWGGELGLNSGVHSYGLSGGYGAGRVKYECNWLLLEQCLRRSKRAGRGCVRMKIKKTRGNVYERVDRSGVIRLHA